LKVKNAIDLNISGNEKPDRVVKSTLAQPIRCILFHLQI